MSVDIARARRYLAQAQDATGGWGYQARQPAFVEPTALCLLALAGSEQLDAQQAGETWLLRAQHPDGGWGVSPADHESCWATAWAIWALARAATTQSGLATTAAFEHAVNWWAAWQDQRGQPSTGWNPVLWIDLSVTGWPWNAGGASWVEPTALGIIALVQAGQGTNSRVAEGVRYLRDRACATGGWNVGNPYMLGQSLPPAIPPTALALLALQEVNVPETDPLVSAGLTTLDGLVQQAHTPLNLAWGLWAASRYRRRSEALVARLSDHQAPTGSWRDSPYLTALAILALAEVA